MRKKILTLNQLVSFCESHNFTKFDSKEAGQQIVVSVPATFEDEKNVTVDNDTLLVCKVKMFHTGVNRNRSNVLFEAAKAALPGIAYTPLLAAFADFTDSNGNTYTDFTSHEIEYDEDGEVVEYIEHQIGAFTSDKPEMIYSPDNGRYYVYAYVAIPRDYTKAAEIIERKDGTKVSVELAVNKMSYDAKEKVLNLEDITVMGCTCLGRNRNNGELVEEGMEGARLDIANFTSNTDIPCSSTEKFEQLVGRLEKLGATLSNAVAIYDERKGGNIKLKFKELLEKYNKVESDVSFDYENMSDEELENAFVEAFGDSDEETEAADESEKEESETTESIETDEPAGAEESTESTESAVTATATNSAAKNNGMMEHRFENGLVKSYELSLNDIERALDNLIGETYNWNAWLVEVYEDSLIMFDYNDQKLYRQNYIRTGNDFTLEGERVEVFTAYVTSDEELALETLRLQYDAISNELAEYKAREDEAKTKELLASSDYDGVRETEEYKALIQETGLKYESVKARADEILLDYAKKGALNFAATNKPVARAKIRVGLDKPAPTKKGRYGNFFTK